MTDSHTAARRPLFLAWEVPAGVSGVVSGAVDDAAAHLDVGWTRPEGWHVTVAWLDRLDAESASDVAAPVADVVAHAPSLGALKLREPVRLGRALALRVEATAAAHRVQRELATRLAATQDLALSERARAGLQRTWRPHVTIARVRGRDAGRAAAVLASLRAVGADVGPEALMWSPHDLVLLESRSGAGAAAYRPLRRWPMPQ